MTFDPSEKLSAESRALLDAAGDGDAPTAADQARVRAGIARRLAIGVAADAVVATTAKTVTAGAAVATSSAASASVGSGVAGAASTMGAGGAAAAGGAIVGTTAAAGGAVAGGAAVFGLAGTGTKILAAIAIASAVGAGTMTYRHTRSIESARAIASASTTEGSERSASARPQHEPGAPLRARPALAAPAAIDSASAIAPVAALPASAGVAASNGSAPRANAIPAGPTLHAAGTNGNAAAAPAASADTSGDLVAELALLRDAHAALQEGDGARALALLSDHARRFPAGALTEEREASRVLALCNVGRAEEARDAASRFLREHPHSPQADRVAHACDASTTF